MWISSRLGKFRIGCASGIYPTKIGYHHLGVTDDIRLTLFSLLRQLISSGKLTILRSAPMVRCRHEPHCFADSSFGGSVTLREVSLKPPCPVWIFRHDSNSQSIIWAALKSAEGLSFSRMGKAPVGDANPRRCERHSRPSDRRHGFSDQEPCDHSGGRRDEKEERRHARSLARRIMASNRVTATNELPMARYIKAAIIGPVQNTRMSSITQAKGSTAAKPTAY